MSCGAPTRVFGIFFSAVFAVRLVGGSGSSCARVCVCVCVRAQYRRSALNFPMRTKSLLACVNVCVCDLGRAIRFVCRFSRLLFLEIQFCSINSDKRTHRSITKSCIFENCSLICSRILCVLDHRFFVVFDHAKFGASFTGPPHTSSRV